MSPAVHMCSVRSQISRDQRCRYGLFFDMYTKVEYAVFFRLLDLLKLLLMAFFVGALLRALGRSYAGRSCAGRDYKGHH